LKVGCCCYLFGVNQGARDSGFVSSSFLGFLRVFLIFFGFIAIQFDHGVITFRKHTEWPAG
jgi:hypothetical protein